MLRRRRKSSRTAERRRARESHRARCLGRLRSIVRSKKHISLWRNHFRLSELAVSTQELRADKLDCWLGLTRIGGTHATPDRKRYSGYRRRIRLRLRFWRRLRVCGEIDDFLPSPAGVQAATRLLIAFRPAGRQPERSKRRTRFRCSCAMSTTIVARPGGVGATRQRRRVLYFEGRAFITSVLLHAEQAPVCCSCFRSTTGFA